jgi:protein-tyrosine-phosphatase
MPSWEIDDPYRGDLFTYEQTAAKIQRHMQEISIFLKIRKK